VCEELHLLFPLQLNRFVVMHQTVADWFLDPTTDSRFRVDRRESNLVLVNSLLYDFEHKFVHETEIAESRGLMHAPLGTCAYAYRYLVDHCDMVTAMTDPAERDRCHISENPCWNPHVSRYLLLKLRYIQGVIGEHGTTELLSQLYSRGTNPYWNTVPDQLAVRAVWMSLHFAKPGLVASNAGDICTQLLARLAGWDANYPVLRELVADASAWFDDHSGYTFHNPVLRAPSSDGECRLKGHTSVVNSVSLVGYDRIVSACNDKTARVWNTVTMECVCILSGHSLWVTGACGLADGRIATSSCDNTVKVWNSVSYEAEIVLNGHRSDVTCIACLSQSEVISGSKDFTIRVWNVFSSSCTQVLKGHESTVTSLCVLSDKRVVSSSKDFTVRIWSTENYACVKILRGHQSFVTSVCCMPDDSIASSSHDMTVRVWTEAGAPYEKIYVGHMNSVSSVCAIRGQGHLIASGSVDMSIPTIRVWNTVTNECECAILTEDEHSVSGLCSLLDGRLVSCSTNCDLCVWDIRRQVYRAMTNWQDYIAISGKVPRQKEFLGLAALSAASTVRVHGLRSSATSTICINNTVLSRKVNGLPLGSSSIVPSAASPTPICIIPLTNSKLIVGCGEDSLRVCDTNTLKQHFVITDGSSVLKSFCVLSSENEETGEISETIVTASPDQTLRLWNTSTGKCEGEISERPLLAMAMCAVGSEFVATVSETGVLSIWDMHTRKKYREHVLEGMVGGVTAVCSYGEGYYYVVIASEDFIVRVWNAKEGDCERVLSGHTARVNAVCVLRGERVVSGSSDKTIRVWGASNGECDKILAGHIGAITAVCPLWGGRIVSGSADRTLRVWDPQRGSCIQRVELSSHDVVSLCELDDGRVASCSLDFMLCYWDTKSHLCEFATAEAGDDVRPPKSDAASESADLLLKEANGHSDAITVLHVHGEGQILSGSKDCTVRMWDTASCSCCQVFRGHKGWIAALCSLGDGSFASGAHDCKIKIWNPDGPCIRTLRGHNFRVVVLRAQGGLLVSGSHDKAVRVWNFATGECHHVLEGHNDWISDIRPLVDGRIVSVSNESVCVWNMATGDLDHVFQGPKSVLRAVCVLSDGRIITGSNDSICGMRFTIHLWEPLADKITRVHNETVEPNESGLSSLFSLPNGRFASINNTNLVRVWCVTANEAICEKKFVLDGAVHYTESEIMSLLNGQAISIPPHPTYLDHDSCTVAIGVLPTLSHHGSSQLLVLGTASGKVHFAGIHCKKV
jgi:WD40 repeat protein